MYIHIYSAYCLLHTGHKDSSATNMRQVPRRSKCVNTCVYISDLIHPALPLRERSPKKSKWFVCVSGDLHVYIYIYMYSYIYIYIVEGVAQHCTHPASNRAGWAGPARLGWASQARLGWAGLVRLG